MNERISSACSNIKPADKNMMDEAKKRQAQLAKPPGSLGVLEDLSIRVAGMTGKIRKSAALSCFVQITEFVTRVFPAPRNPSPFPKP